MTPVIHLATPAWDAIRREIIAEAGPLETGGILLGHDFGDVLQVTVAGDPGPKAQRRRDRFLRDRDHAERLAASAWEADRAQWIGEWHTHPATRPVPSPIDLTSYACHLQDSDLGFDRFLSIIIGLDDSDQERVAGWIVTRSAATLVPVSIGGPND